MNQILCTNLELNKKKQKEKKQWFLFQLFFSSSIMVVLVLAGSFYFYHLQKKENFSNHLLASYNISRLYHHSDIASQENDIATSNQLFRHNTNPQT